ncbi:hypothetical protein FACS189429_5530 [Bacteroidia bacterium]|nr:hypothetical protein FACS189429_5530 [Bacteroidia bacterium]
MENISIAAIFGYIFVSAIALFILISLFKLTRSFYRYRKRNEQEETETEDSAD